MGYFTDLVRSAGLPSGSQLMRSLLAISERVETTIQAVQITSPAPNTNSLRALSGTPGSITVLVDPVHGGPFSYSDVSAVDDGGAVLNAGGLGSNMPGWRRVYSGYADLRWWQPDRTGVADSASAFNAALGYLSRQSRAAPVFVGNGLQTTPTLFVPGGTYRINSTVNVGAYMCVQADQGAMVFSEDPTLSMFSSYNYYVTFRRIAFVGGRHAVMFYGSAGGGPSVGGPNWFERCSFRYQYGPSLFQNTAGPGGDRGMSATILVDNFDFQGACLWWGGSDQAIFRNGHVIVDHGTRPAYFDGPGARLLPGWMNTGVLDLENISANPLYTGGKNSAWIEGHGIISTRRMRFGGEDNLVPYRVRCDPAKLQYNGFQAAADPESLTEIYSDSDPQASTNTRNFVEVYDKFPSVIDIRRVMPFPVAVGRSYTEFASPGAQIWVDRASCPASSFRDSPRSSLRVLFDTVARPRIVTGSGPTDVEEEITHLFEQFLDAPTGMGAPLVQENLWPATGVLSANLAFDPSWGYYGIFNSVDVSTDSSLGYPIRTWTSNIPQQGANIYGTCGVNDTVFWGSGLPAGVYTLSVYVKANFSGQLNFGRDVSTGAMATARFVASPRWQRLWCRFSHDGGNHLLGFSVYSIPGTSDPRGPGSIALACPAVHYGSEPAGYTRPGNATLIDLIRSTYYGTAPPVAGTYLVGDRVVNTSPSAGGWSGWVCTAGGSPGTWKGYGAIET